MSPGCRLYVDKMGQNDKIVGELGIDEMGLDEMGINHNFTIILMSLKVMWYITQSFKYSEVPLIRLHSGQKKSGFNNPFTTVLIARPKWDFWHQAKVVLIQSWMALILGGLNIGWP